MRLRTWLRQAVTASGVDVAAGEEAVGEPDGAELEAAGGERLAALADQQLGRAAADVDEEQPPVEHGHRLEHAEVDQPGLLDAGDHLDVDAGLGWARSMNSSALTASRTALVATARTTAS